MFHLDIVKSLTKNNVFYLPCCFSLLSVMPTDLFLFLRSCCSCSVFRLFNRSVIFWHKKTLIIVFTICLHQNVEKCNDSSLFKYNPWILRANIHQYWYKCSLIIQLKYTFISLYILWVVLFKYACMKNIYI